MPHRNPIQCIVPPYITERLARSTDPLVRGRALGHLAAGAAIRARRDMVRIMPALMATAAPTREKHRLVYDARNTDDLPGRLVRAEGKPRTRDAAIDEAYDHSGDTYDFYRQIFERNSLDGVGMSLISSVHVADVDENGDYVPMDNAFWDGEQMAYGDGDGIVFRRFTRSLDVVGHELTHGVQAHTSNLPYRGQPGALNEHFADVFGVLIRQWKQGEEATKANWLIGAEVLVPAKTRRAIRDMANPGTAFKDDPYLETDPQPAHMKDLYEGAQDHGGVHLNSGIPNNAFAEAAKAIGGNAWETAGQIWYDTMLRLPRTADFKACAKLSVQIAATHGPAAKKAVAAAWKVVGLTV